jgi:hypothetical protein
VGSATKRSQIGLSGHGQKVRRKRECKESSLKMKERSLNVYENKGPLWITCERSLNVFESKGG